MCAGPVPAHNQDAVAVGAAHREKPWISGDNRAADGTSETGTVPTRGRLAAARAGGMAGEVHHRGILQIAAVLAVPHIADLCHHERRAVLWIIQPAYLYITALH